MVYLFLANGFEEIEALTPVDVLRRAGVAVVTVSTEQDLTVTGAHGIRVTADVMLSEIDIEKAEMMILPGGSEGTRRLKENGTVREMIVSCNSRGVYIAAICAAPTILAEMGLLRGIKATCYPSLVSVLTDNQVKYKNDKVVSDKNFITSMGAGTSGDFAFVLVDKLVSKKESDSLRIAMVY